MALGRNCGWNVRDETALWGYEFSSLAKEGFHDNLSWRVFTVPSYIIYICIYLYKHHCLSVYQTIAFVVVAGEDGRARVAPFEKVAYGFDRFSKIL